MTHTESPSFPSKGNRSRHSVPHREKHQKLSAGTEAGPLLSGPGEAPEDPLAQLLQVLQDLQAAHSSSPASSAPAKPNCLLELQT